MENVIGIMLSAQADVQRTLGNDLANMADENRMRYMTEMAFSLCDEVHEAMGEVGWKSWAKSNHINAEEFMGEMTDAWLFFMNLMLAAGMTAEDLILRTAKKQDNTLARFFGGYDGKSTKCPKCQRAYDNDGVKCTPAHAGPEGAGAARCGYEDVSGNVSCASCGRQINDVAPFVMCRPANAYQGTVAFCETNGQHLAPITLPDWSTHCMACCAPLNEFGCNNPSKQGMGWCGRYKAAHSDHYGLLHPSHGKP